MDLVEALLALIAACIVPLVAQGVHIWTDWPLATYRAATGEAIDRDTF